MNQQAAAVHSDSDKCGTRLRLLSYNIQVGIETKRAHHYLLHGWKHFLPHTRRFHNLDLVAEQVQGYDIVGMQETDAGSLRSNFINLTEYIASKAGFPFWHHRINRRLGNIAQHSSGMLFRIKPSEIKVHKLPALIPGRGVCMARFGNKDESLAVFNIHLSLSRRARGKQLGFIAELSQEYAHVVMMGDLNTSPNSPEMKHLFRNTSLIEPLDAFHTFPSWQPSHHLDHILVSSELKVHDARVLSHSFSDHLPIAMEIEVPDSVKLR
ncbi:MAG: endonuclease/exonuclease/phosphatase family protein [Gammaproteobacteria bacterium]|nr:endonuclease/exonuclease/phosphatase family protein [Gammaproteobacteria bacterium]